MPFRAKLLTPFETVLRLLGIKDDSIIMQNFRIKNKSVLYRKGLLATSLQGCNSFLTAKGMLRNMACMCHFFQ